MTKNLIFNIPNSNETKVIDIAIYFKRKPPTKAEIATFNSQIINEVAIISSFLNTTEHNFRELQATNFETYNFETAKDILYILKSESHYLYSKAIILATLSLANKITAYQSKL